MTRTVDRRHPGEDAGTLVRIGLPLYLPPPARAAAPPPVGGRLAAVVKDGYWGSLR